MISLTLILTEKCNARCRHCFEENCEYTNQNASIDIRDGKRYIDEIVEIAHQENKKVGLHFSGGEVFLVYNNMLQLCKYAHSKGITNISCTTNGYWGRSIEKSKEKIKSLSKYGLNLIGFSLDEFHQEYINIQHVRNAIQITQEIGLRFAIKTVATKKSKRLPDVLLDISDLLLNSTFSCQEIPYIPYNPSGRIPQEDILTMKDLPTDPCPSFVITILPDGTIFPCCSIGWTDNLIIGNAKEESLNSVWARLNSNTIFEILQDKGPAYIAKYMDESGMSNFENNKYANYCHLCYELFKSDSINSKITDLLSIWKKERVEKILSVIEH